MANSRLIKYAFTCWFGSNNSADYCQGNQQLRRKKWSEKYFGKERQKQKEKASKEKNTCTKEYAMQSKVIG